MENQIEDQELSVLKNMPNKVQDIYKRFAREIADDGCDYLEDDNGNWFIGAIAYRDLDVSKTPLEDIESGKVEPFCYVTFFIDVHSDLLVLMLDDIVFAAYPSDRLGLSYAIARTFEEMRKI
ncbi:hypothetical protein [Aeromonas salmonicida]|uniref:hypothetical protein n=1 Tax=Aeromonas salmonicida TaxID=645 RepID=UPI003D3137AD